MHLRRLNFLPLLLFTVTGCGTFKNLKDPSDGTVFICDGCCYPFGGVTRSGTLAVMGPPIGLGGVISGNIALTQGDFGSGFEQIGNGTYLTAAGLLAIADTPLSLVGDVLTFPLAYARSNGYSWATWWGEKSIRNPGTRVAPAPGGDNKTDGRSEPADTSPTQPP
jgi:uncharacterized protein YceK